MGGEPNRRGRSAVAAQAPDEEAAVARLARLDRLDPVAGEPAPPAAAGPVRTAGVAGARRRRSGGRRGAAPGRSRRTPAGSRPGRRGRRSRRGRGAPRASPTLKATRPSGSRPTLATALRIASAEGSTPRTRARGELAGEEQHAVAAAAADLEDPLGGAGRAGRRRQAASGVARAPADDRNRPACRRDRRIGTSRLLARRWRQERDPRLIVLAVFALIAVGVVAAILIGRGGGGSDSTTTASAAGCKQVEAPKPKQVSLAAPKQTVKKGEKLTAVVETSCGTFEIALDTTRAPKTVNSFAYLSEQGLLRRPHLPPDRARIRDPGRRPARQRHRRPRLQRRREAARPTSPTPRASSRWRRARPSRPGARAASSSSSPAPTPACRRNTPWSARSSRGYDVVDRIGKLGTPAEKPKQTVLIEKITIEKG